MGDEVKFDDNRVKVKEVLSSVAFKALEEAAGELEAQTKRNSRVDTGQTKNSFRHAVTGGSLLHEYTAIVGSDYENAIWEEFGTGEWALEGNGRKGSWKYRDAKGNWHTTSGKTPNRAMYRAFTELKDKLIRHIQEEIKKGMS